MNVATTKPITAESAGIAGCAEKSKSWGPLTTLRKFAQEKKILGDSYTKKR
jgi:hypothetical protein